MHRSIGRRLLVVVAVAVTGLALAGCPSKSDSQKGGGDQAAGDKGAADKTAKWLGTYEQQSKDAMVLVIKPEHKGTLASAGQPGEITWEVNGDDKITVSIPIPMTMFRTSDGNLRDAEGTTWKKTK